MANSADSRKREKKMCSRFKFRMECGTFSACLFFFYDFSSFVSHFLHLNSLIIALSLFPFIDGIANIQFIASAQLSVDRYFIFQLTADMEFIAVQ